MTKMNEAEINNYKDIIKELSKKIETLQTEIINKINKQIKEKEFLKRQKIELIYTNPKILSKILSYLKNQKQFNFSKCNIFYIKVYIINL